MTDQEKQQADAPAPTKPSAGRRPRSGQEKEHATLNATEARQAEIVLDTRRKLYTYIGITAVVVLAGFGILIFEFARLQG